MKLSPFVVAMAVAVVGCAGYAGASSTQVDVEVKNLLSLDIHNAYGQFGEFKCKWGTVKAGTSAGYGFFPHPITATVELHWDTGAGHQAKTLDLRGHYTPGKSGRLTFIIYADRVEVSFDEKS